MRWSALLLLGLFAGKARALGLPGFLRRPLGRAARSNEKPASLRERLGRPSPSGDGAWATIDDTWQLADSCIDDDECSLEDAMALLDSLDEMRIWTRRSATRCRRSERGLLPRSTG